MRKVAFMVTVLLLVILFGSCSTLFDDLASGTGILDKTEARLNQAALDAVGLGALEDSVLATIIYTQVFYAGGYAYGYDSFEEGEGVVWDIRSSADQEEDTLRVERALLKRTAEGSSWWFLKYSAEGEDPFVSEALIGEEYELLKFRYRDPETGDIREWIPEQEESAEESADESEEEMGEEEPDFYRGGYEEFNRGRESITVPAGTYQAEHILIEESFTVEEEGTSEVYILIYEWWISDQVPGEIVRYEWTNTQDESALTGELVAHNRGYRTQLDSY